MVRWGVGDVVDVVLVVGVGELLRLVVRNFGEDERGETGGCGGGGGGVFGKDGGAVGYAGTVDGRLDSLDGIEGWRLLHTRGAEWSWRMMPS